ncbi:MAG: DUF4190 domain-containing protein [Acidimicrobiales bacterium]
MSVHVAGRPGSEQATLRLTRHPARWRDRSRSYKVVIDDAVIGKIRNGETADFRIPAGRHEVAIKLDWARSNASTLKLGAGELAHFECEPAGSSLTSFFDVFAAMGKKGRPWIDLHQVPSDSEDPSQGHPSGQSAMAGSPPPGPGVPGPVVDVPSPTCDVTPMQSASPSPGWWVASDGNWYPPRTAPPNLPYAPPSPCRPYQQLPPVRTNGLATASLVLGILWIGGLGSILALVFGTVGKEQIEVSGGRQRGRGMAVAGIVLGWIGVTALTLFIGLAVIGAFIGTTPTTTTTVPSVAASAQTYLALVAPANSSAATFASEAAQWNSQTTNAQAESQAQPFIAALQNFRKQLLSTAWPTSARRDVKALAADVTPVVADLRGLAKLHLSNASGWATQFQRGISVMKASDNVVRHDLGLPPVSPGGGTPTLPSNSTPTVPSNSTPTVPSNSTPGGASSTTLPAGNTSPSTAGGNNAGGGGGNGGATCFGCVTITTVTWTIYPGPDIPSDEQNCVSASSTVASNTQVVGPNITNPNREFTYSVQYANGCSASDGSEFTVGKVDLQGANPPISIVSTDPAVPFGIAPGASQELAVTFQALEGNYYDGPLVINVIVD